MIVLECNVHSLMSWDRFDMIFNELCSVHWTILVLVKTSRDREIEKWKTTNGAHISCGGGEMHGPSGRGVLVYQSCIVLNFLRMSERVSYTDVLF